MKKYIVRICDTVENTSESVIAETQLDAISSVVQDRYGEIYTSLEIGDDRFGSGWHDITGLHRGLTPHKTYLGRMSAIEI